MDEIKKLWRSNRPLFIAVVGAVAVLVYILIKNQNATVTAPTSGAGDTSGAGVSAPTGTYGGGGTYVEESYYSNAPTSNTSTTYTPGQAATPATPVATATPAAKTPAPVAAVTSAAGGLLGAGARIFPNYVGTAYYYRSPKTGGKIVPIPLPAGTCYQPGAQGRYWYQSPCGSAGKLLTSG